MGKLETARAGTYHAFGFEKSGHRCLGQVQHLFNRQSTFVPSSLNWRKPSVEPCRVHIGC